MELLLIWGLTKKYVFLNVRKSFSYLFAAPLLLKLYVTDTYKRYVFSIVNACEVIIFVNIIMDLYYAHIVYVSISDSHKTKVSIQCIYTMSVMTQS